MAKRKAISMDTYIRAGAAMRLLDQVFIRCISAMAPILNEKELSGMYSAWSKTTKAALTAMQKMLQDVGQSVATDQRDLVHVFYDPTIFPTDSIDSPVNRQVVERVREFALDIISEQAKTAAE